MDEQDLKAAQAPLKARYQTDPAAARVTLRAGGSLGEGKKSLAITVRLQPREATLKEAEIEAVSRKIIEKVTKATGGVLRG